MPDPCDVKHPEPGEWMTFVYGEATPDRRRELSAHLATCEACAAQVHAWRGDMAQLDEWRMPRIRTRTRRRLVDLRWAAAAALFVVAGIALGRSFAPATDELTALKVSVAQVMEELEQTRRTLGGDPTGAARQAAQDEAMQLMAEYLQVQESLRLHSEQNVSTALSDFESRLDRLRAELQTVAVNAESGFEQTQNRIAYLAHATLPQMSADASSHAD